MTLYIVVGGFWGDEGKGKIASYLAYANNVEAVARAGVGTNAGHTVVFEGETYKLRTIPSGFMIEDAKMYVGAGVLINEKILFDEIKLTNTEGRVFLDNQTGVITDDHIKRENANNHLMENIGSTGSGCGEANVDRVRRQLKLAKDYHSLRPISTDVSEELNDILDQGGSVVIEGSQATFLSLYHGTYPHVTSKDVTASSCLADVGIGPTRADEVVVVFKGFVTRVGEGELDGELAPDEAKERGWDEYGTVTGRQRRAAPFDFDLAKKACRINGATAIALTKMDIVFPELEGSTDPNSLSAEVKEFVDKVEKTTGVKVKWLSTGPETKSVIDLS